MRIEISAGGLFPESVNDFQSGLSSHIVDSEAIIESFVAVRDSTNNLNGGVGALHGALNDVNARICAEEERRIQSQSILQKANQFVNDAVCVDAEVSRNLNRNHREMYSVNLWTRPAVGAEYETPWYEKAIQWLGDKISDGVDAVRKIKESIKEYYLEHKKVIDTILIVIGAVVAIAAVVITCGWALAPLLISIGVSASAALTISTIVGIAAIITTVGSSTLDIVDIWYEIDQPVFNVSQTILGISSSIFNGVYGIGMIYNAFKGYRIVRYNGIRMIQNDHIFDPKVVDNMGRNNNQRMKENLAPIGKDGKSLELHHFKQTENSGIIELTRTDHRGAGRFAYWHSNLGRGSKSVVDHGTEWNKFRKMYWAARGTGNKVLYDVSTGVTGIIDVAKSLVETDWNFERFIYTSPIALMWP